MMFRGWVLLALLAMFSHAVAGPVLQAVYPEPAAGEGFFDETPAEPVPGNPGRTLGEQRRFVLEHVLDILSSYIDSDVTIRIRATFTDLGCDPEADTLVLARGGALYRAMNFANTRWRNTYFPGSLASHIAGHRLDPGTIEGRVMFNKFVEAGDECPDLDGHFWYGIGEPSSVDSVVYDFLSVALHEVVHALGFTSMTDPHTREFTGNPPRRDIHSLFVYSPDFTASWPWMLPAERVASADMPGGLTWSGGQGNRWATETLRPPAEVKATWGGGRVRKIPARMHGLRPLLPLEGMEGQAVLADNAIDETGIDGVVDGPRYSDDACQPLDNSDEVKGRILLVRRGGCYFRTKWHNAQAAGAIAVLAVDHHSADHPEAIQRDHGIATASGVSIPLWTVARDKGKDLLENPPRRMQLGYDLSAPLMGTRHGQLMLSTEQENPGSNASHVSADLVPRSWMASSIGGGSGNHHGHVGAVPGLLFDLGWRDFSAKRGQWAGNWYDSGRSGEGCQLTLEGDEKTWILTCYMYADGDQVWMIGSAKMNLNRLSFEPMNITRGANYGPDFDADDVVMDEWGRVEIEFIGCNHASFRFIPLEQDLPAFDRHLDKIVDGDCRLTGAEQPDRDWSGNFYNPQRSGEGVQLSQEADGGSIVMTWYSYAQGKQFWAIGTGSWDEPGQRMRFDSLHTTQGGDYGPEFDPDSVETIPFGSAELTFSDCNNADLTIASDLEGFADIKYPVTRIVPRYSCP